MMKDCPTCDGDGLCPFCAACDEPQPDCPYGHDGCVDGTCTECDGDGEVEDYD